MTGSSGENSWIEPLQDAYHVFPVFSKKKETQRISVLCKDWWNSEASCVVNEGSLESYWRMPINALCMNIVGMIFLFKHPKHFFTTVFMFRLLWYCRHHHSIPLPLFSAKYHYNPYFGFSSWFVRSIKTW